MVSSSSFDNVHLWDAETFIHLKTLEGDRTDVFSVAYSPDGKTIAGAFKDGSAHIWDAETGALLKTLKGHHGAVRWAAYSSDAKTLATASDDGSIILWDISNL